MDAAWRLLPPGAPQDSGQQTATARSTEASPLGQGPSPFSYTLAAVQNPAYCPPAIRYHQPPLFDAAASWSYRRQSTEIMVPTAITAAGPDEPSRFAAGPAEKSGTVSPGGPQAISSHVVLGCAAVGVGAGATVVGGGAVVGLAVTAGVVAVAVTGGAAVVAAEGWSTAEGTESAAGVATAAAVVVISTMVVAGATVVSISVGKVVPVSATSGAAPPRVAS